MPAGTNNWALGTMYGGGLLNGQPFYTQPGGPFTAVYPTQKNASPFVDYPISGLFVNEFLPWVPIACGHSIHQYEVIREFDYNTQLSCALIVCPICSFCQNVYEPYEEWLDPIQHAIIVG